MRIGVRQHSAYDLGTLAQATESFSGAELEAVVNNSAIAAFVDGAEARMTDAHLMAAARAVRPQALGQKGQRLIALLAEKARDGWRPASTPPPTEAVIGAAFERPVIPRDGLRDF